MKHLPNGSTNHLLWKIYGRQQKKCKAVIASHFSTKAQVSICLQLRYVFKNHAITSFTTNNQSIKGYHLLTAKKAKQTQELLLEVNATAYKGLKTITQKDKIIDHKKLSLLLLWEKYISELEQQKQPNKIVTPTN